MALCLPPVELKSIFLGNAVTRFNIDSMRGYGTMSSDPWCFFFMHTHEAPRRTHGELSGPHENGRQMIVASSLSVPLFVLL